MSREEAIKELQESLDTLREYDIAHSSRLKQALEMAIQALSQDPCDETVSREVVYQLLLDMASSAYGFEEIRRIVDKLPSATQKPNFCASCKHNTDNEICLECEYDGITRGMTRYESVTQKSGWNNHQIACMLADLFGDVCACNYNGIDEWLPELCDFKDTCCPKPIGVACWEQFLKYIKSKYCECEEPCDDAVSREAVKEIIARNDSTNGTVAVFTGKQVIAMINKLPSVTRQTKSHKEKVTYHKCKECQWLANEKTVIGRKCVNPHKVWKSRTAMWHQPSCKACKMFKPYKEGESE